ncbi:MAG: YdeI/OmpD-associated family protein [Thermomonas sp.]|uniref:YdeI/OmpD-associated family protein n=1 Tax=Thermomonas sp. TaxID=1971895 RepID=UPI0039E3D6E9
MSPEPSSPIRFKATLLRPAMPKNATWRFLRLPKSASARLPSRGMVSVEGMFAGQPFKATLEPDGEGSHWLKVPRALHEAAGIEASDTVALEIAPAAKEPEPRLPPDLRKALAGAPAALAQWKTITAAARRDFIQWLSTAKQVDTRARRIRNACDMLAAGKRRICCFDRSGIYSRGNIGAPEAARD